MPGKGDGSAAARARAVAPKFRLPPTELVQTVALETLRAMGRKVPSQTVMRRALAGALRDEDPLFTIGRRRLRAVLLKTPGVRLAVKYSMRIDRRPLSHCPVCASALIPIRNRTLYDDEVTLGYRCPECAYWTHLHRRVPVRYAFLLGARRRGNARPARAT